MDGVPSVVLELVKGFRDNYETYVSTSYKESHLETEFIKRLFGKEGLGWDIENKERNAPENREVIPQDSIKIEGSTKAPDYCFRVGEKGKFYLEVKRPSINIREAKESAFQLRRYGYSAEFPVSILTNFKDLFVYDCSVKPKKTDNARVARILDIPYEQLPDNWAKFTDIFSRNAVWKTGGFERFTKSEKGKRGTSPVTDDFLKDIERWRELLAKNIALRNPDLTVRQLNFAVQITIDRIIFLRMCEDRGSEKYGQLQSIIESENSYTKLLELYELADERYNSGLFYFKEERERPSHIDELTPKLIIDNKTLKDIITELYPPDCPYEFSVLSAHTLGNVYEQFLGKVIHLTAGHRAVIEEKPEVKKAGGVYYTPKYIVDYIVENTVEKLINGKTPKQISKLRILDPACGSGSFLLAAYQKLLDHHLKWYRSHNPSGHKGAVFKGKGDEWYLTIEEKKQILLNNIYGVDIDGQAVEVTKLNLLLKVLEGEYLDPQKRLRARLLPDLGKNIMRGNSLIGPDFYTGQTKLFDMEERERITVFDWEKAFPFKFDAVIGNPPYIRIQAMKEWAPTEVEFYKDAYKSASKGNYDIYVVFIEKGLSLLNEKGALGFICPHKFFNAQYGEPLREIIAEGRNLSEIVHFGDQQVFEKATTYTCLLFLTKDNKGRKFSFAKVDDLDAWRATREAKEGKIDLKDVTRNEWNFATGKSAKLFEKLSKMPVKLGDIANIFVGTQTSADDVFVIENAHKEGEYFVGTSNLNGETIKVEAGIIKPFLRGKDIRRYQKVETKAVLVCPYEITRENFRLYTPEEMSKLFPLTLKYLDSNRDKLVSREGGKFKGTKWYAFGYPKSMTLFQKEKLIVPDYNNVASFTLDTKSHFYKTGYGLILKNPDIDIKYLLGLLNSRLLFEYLSTISTSLRGGYIRFWTQFIEKLPIKIINSKNPAEKRLYESIISLVNIILELNTHLSSAKTPDEETMLQCQIDAVDKQIDNLVYELYGLTKDEKELVEKMFSKN